MLSGTEILATEASTIRVRQGWMAVSKPGSGLRIGVQAATEAEALEAFQEALHRRASYVAEDAELGQPLG